MPFKNMFGKLIDGIDPSAKITPYLAGNGKDSTSAETEFTMAKTCLNNNELDAAFDHLKKSVRFHAKYTKSYIYMSRIYQMKNMNLDARKLLESAVYSINNYSLYSELSGIYQKNGMQNKTLDLWKNFIKKFPDSEKGYMHIGNYYSSIGQSSKALVYYEKVLSFNKNSSVAKGEMIDIHIKNGNLEQAEKILVELFDNSVNSSVKWENGERLIRLYLLFGENRKAYDFLNNIEKFANQEDEFLLLADVLIVNSEFDKATLYLKRIKKINPLNNNIYIRLAFINTIKEEKDILRDTLKMLSRFVQNNVINNILNNYEQLSFDEIRENIFSVYSNISGIDFNSLLEILKENENHIEDNDTDRSKNQNIDLIDQNTDEFRDLSVLKIIEDLTYEFESELSIQSKLISEIGKTIMFYNISNNKNMEKIIEFVENGMDYVKQKEYINESDILNFIGNYSSNIKKGMDLNEKNNLKIFRKINEFRKKNMQLKGNLEKLFYRMSNINKMIKNQDDIEEILDYLKSMSVNNE